MCLYRWDCGCVCIGGTVGVSVQAGLWVCLYRWDCGGVCIGGTVGVFV